MNRIIKNKYLFLAFTLALAVTIPHNVYAMHIGEGYLPLNWNIFYYVLVIPFLIVSVKTLRKYAKKGHDIKMLLGLLAAFVFIMSALKLPSVTGSSSHPTGVGIGAIILGPMIMPVISLIVLLFQAILLAHGGLTTLGANLFSMGIVGPLVSYGVYRLLRNKNKTAAVWVGVALGDLATYLVTSIQLALAFPSPEGGVVVSFVKFAGIFAITQIPLAIVEGGISVVLFDYIKKHCTRELKEIGGELI